MGSRNPRKIGMGVPNILGFVARGAGKWGCRFFCDTGLGSENKTIISSG